MRIPIKGTIVGNDSKWLYDLCGMTATCPRDIEEALASAGSEGVDVDINSGGGEIFAGSEIYNLLRNAGCKVRLHVVGWAASAASVIMCAGDCDIAPTGMVMIHNVSTVASGDYRDLHHQGEVLDKATDAMAQAYVRKTGRELSEFRALMDRETWMTAQEAVQLGLCDRIAGEEPEVKLQLVAAAAPVIPQEAVNAMAKLKADWDAERQQLISDKQQLQNAFARYIRMEAKK